MNPPASAWSWTQSEPIDAMFVAYEVFAVVPMPVAAAVGPPSYYVRTRHVTRPATGVKNSGKISRVVTQLAQLTYGDKRGPVMPIVRVE
jgi:hypothetical protein